MTISSLSAYRSSEHCNINEWDFGFYMKIETYFSSYLGTYLYYYYL